MTEIALPRPVAARRFMLLLGAMIALLITAPLFGDSTRAQTELALLFSLLVIGFVLASERQRLIAVALAIFWFGLTWLADGSLLLADIALLGLCLTAIDSVLSHVLSARNVTGEVLAAAISAYLLMGVSWAVVFTILETLVPGSLNLTDASGDQWSTILYFSFATLTTLGYGDVAPVTTTARAWATIEALGGTLYLAILIARLVSLYKAGPEAASE